MVLSWLRARRRKAWARKPFPADWSAIIERNVVAYEGFSREERLKAERDIRVLVAEKYWEGCGGLAMTDEIKVTIAAQIAHVTLGFEDEYFNAVKSILVYPTAYSAPGRTVIQAGVVLEGESHRLGEAWYRGPVVLSWDDVLAAGREETDGQNLVAHEFAHQLDYQNESVADGLPPMSSRQQFERWRKVTTAIYDDLRRDCQDGSRHSAARRVLDCYGATNPAEFFAVTSERFFAAPRELKHHLPELYSLLAEFYRQDTAERAAKL